MSSLVFKHSLDSCKSFYSSIYATKLFIRQKICILPPKLGITKNSSVTITTNSIHNCTLPEIFPRKLSSSLAIPQFPHDSLSHKPFLLNLTSFYSVSPPTESHQKLKTPKFSHQKSFFTSQVPKNKSSKDYLDSDSTNHLTPQEFFNHEYIVNSINNDKPKFVNKFDKTAHDQLFAEIDKTNNGYISQSDFKDWYQSVLNGKLKGQNNNNTHQNNSEGNFESKFDNTSEVISKKPSSLIFTKTQIILIFTHGAIPFISLGFIDNCLMILCGDLIDRYFGVLFGLSTLAAAGLGNTVSCASGVMTGGFVERVISKMGLPEPDLTQEQFESQFMKNIRLFGSFIGVIIGCLLGISPLMFLTPHGNQTPPQVEQ